MVGTLKLYTEKPCLGIDRDREEGGGRRGGGYIGTQVLVRIERDFTFYWEISKNLGCRYRHQVITCGKVTMDSKRSNSWEMLSWLLCYENDLETPL